MPDLAELCRIHEIGLDLIERSHDVDELLDCVLDEYEERLRELPGDALDGRAAEAQPASLRKLRALVMFATQAAALQQNAAAAAELRERARMLEQANARLDGVLDALSSGVLILRADGTIAKANAAARALVREADEKGLARVITGGVPSGGEAEIDFPSPEGSGRTLLLARRPLANDPECEVVLVTDVTRRNRAIEERMRIEKLGEVLKTLSVLSHKINNPLTALLGRAQILQSRAAVDSSTAKAVAVIEESSLRIAELIRELGRVVKEGRQGALDDLLDMGEGTRAEEASS